MPASQAITALALTSLTASPTNPRKNFDVGKLTELAESIKASGVHQPILVRPLPGARVPDTDPGVTHEIVAGERRYRASQMAGVPTIPAWVRELSDQQVLEIQLVENLLRDDLTPLEEAEGYGHLLRQTDMDRVQLAAKIGKSVSYVHARLKLLDLGAEGRKALAEGRIDASTALLVARIPSTELQAKATTAITQRNFDGVAMSYRRAAEYVQREYMLRLNDAKFSRTDAALVPEAGPCSTCPKRTGANPDIFADVKSADVCTDPPCYRAKEAAHQARERARAEERGQTIIDGREARELMPHSWSGRVEGHLRLDAKEDSPTGEPLRKLLKQQLASGDLVPVLVANPHKAGELVAVISDEQAALALGKLGRQKDAVQIIAKGDDARKWKEEQALEEARRDLETRWRWQVLEAIWPAAQAREPVLSEGNASILRMAALHYWRGLNMDKAKALCKLLDLGKVAPKDGVKQWIRDTPTPMAALALMAARDDVEYAWWRSAGEEDGDRGRDENAGLWAVADVMGVDHAGIEREARSEARRAEAARKKSEKTQKTQGAAPTPPDATPPAARASGARGGAKAKTGRPAARARTVMPKTSAAHASAQIADALNALQEGQDQAPPAQSDEAPPAPDGQAAGCAAPHGQRPANAQDGAAATAQLAPDVRVRIKPSAQATRQRPYIGETGTVRYKVGLGRDNWRVALPTAKGDVAIESFAGVDLEVLP